MFTVIKLFYILYNLIQSFSFLLDFAQMDHIVPLGNQKRVL